MQFKFTQDFLSTVPWNAHLVTVSIDQLCGQYLNLCLQEQTTNPQMVHSTVQQEKGTEEGESTHK